MTLLLLALVLPAVMQGITLANGVGGTARRRTEAAGLADEKLNELLALSNNQVPTNGSGDFSPNFPDYSWQMTVQSNWPLDTTGSLYQVDLSVFWTDYGRKQSLTLSTLVYPRTTGTSSTSGTSGTKGTP